MNNCHSSSRPPTPGHAATVRARWPAAIVAMCSTAAAGEAAARTASTIKYPPRVQAVLEYLQLHPMTVTSQAMQYDAEPTTPLPACVAGLSPDVVVPASSSGEPPHMARVIAGLLLAACGQPIAGSPAAAEAAYVHAIVHRQEGQCIGEFGSGLSNANYWYKASGDLPIAGDLLKAARKLAAGKPECEAHVAKHGTSWQASKFVGLCDQVAAGGSSEALRSFCEGVMAAEMQLLLSWCYSQMNKQ